jgi:hypothetical protein
MAIIAFCLVAIMALVRDVTPPEAQIPIAETQPAPTPEPVVPTPKPVAQVQVEKIQVEKIQVAQAPEPKAQTSETQEAKEQLAAVAVEQAQPQPQPKPAPADEPGLSLRFGTDKDFLRLIARGDVGVYLFDAQNTYRLSKSYAFSKAPAPGQIYELMPSTIPGAIKRAAEGSVANSAGYRWGVVMPERIASRIQTLVQTQRSGQLVINRFGEVRHQPDRALAGG